MFQIKKKIIQKNYKFLRFKKNSDNKYGVLK